jgi:hypothetical protein
MAGNQQPTATPSPTPSPSTNGHDASYRELPDWEWLFEHDANGDPMAYVQIGDDGHFELTEYSAKDGIKTLRQAYQRCVDARFDSRGRRSDKGPVLEEIKPSLVRKLINLVGPKEADKICNKAEDEADDMAAYIARAIRNLERDR